VLVECSPDRLLAGEALRKLNIRMPVRHCGGKGRVVNALTSRYRGSVGIIDEDPGSAQPRQLRLFETVREEPSAGLRILAHPRTRSHVVVLMPRLEEWLLEAAREAGVEPDRYSLPNDPSLLHSVINLDPRKLQGLLRDILRQPRGRAAALLSALREVLSG